jgi:hypothetical protein
MSNSTIRAYRAWLDDPANADDPGRWRVEEGLADELRRAGLQPDAAAPHDPEAALAASILNAAGIDARAPEREPQTEDELAAQILASYRGQ